MTTSLRTLAFAPLAFMAAVIAATATASAEPIKIDLNKLEPQDDACRAYFVLENSTDSSFSSFTLDLFLFGADGVVTKRVVMDSAPLDPAKIRVRPVDFREVDCSQISMVLINDILKCEDASGVRNDCIGLIELTNHTNAKFMK
ncbi:MAG: Tat pathway signal sequence domain protein [Kiloniellales bacterium]